MANNRKHQSHVTNAMRKKTLFVTVCACLCFAIVAANMFRIQILNYEKYKTHATQIQLRETELSARRGTIYDANMKVLAQTATVWTIFVSPAESKTDQHRTIAQ
ncbi:MAG: hypothetical protein J6K80_05480, partial [Oscillospiraceae bacterium]|nr:hypothetical protein [Oscillospiraceae bacterium]